MFIPGGGGIIPGGGGMAPFEPGTVCGGYDIPGGAFIPGGGGGGGFPPPIPGGGPPMPGGGPIPGGAFIPGGGAPIPGGGAPIPGGGPIPGGYRFGSDMLVFPRYTKSNNTEKEEREGNTVEQDYGRMYTLTAAAKGAMISSSRLVSIFASSILPLRHPEKMVRGMLSDVQTDYVDRIYQLVVSVVS
jgi:hypothetical protein